MPRPLAKPTAYRIGDDQVRGSLQCGISARHLTAVGHFRQIGILPTLTDVRFAPKADTRTLASVCPLSADIVAKVENCPVTIFPP
jgi:hypothetical protein